MGVFLLYLQLSRLEVLMYDMKKEINVTQYQEGIFDVCDFLVTELISFLKEEGRYKFRMITYMKACSKTFDKIRQASLEEINIYGRVLYVLSRAISKDYLRLRQKRLTPADATICIILKLIETSESLEGGNNRYLESQEELKSILSPIYDNIKNRAKRDHLWKTVNSIRDSVKSSKYGALSLDSFSLREIENPTPKEQEITGEKEGWSVEGGTNEKIF